MGIGYIVVQLFTKSKTLAIKNPKVIVTRTENNKIVFKKDLTIDSNGKSEKIAVEAPDKELSQKPIPGVIPYTTYDISATADGFNETRILGVQVFPDVTAIQNIEMLPSINGKPGVNIIIIKPHQLVIGINSKKH